MLLITVMNWKLGVQIHNRITTLTAVNSDLDDLTRRRERLKQWAVDMKNTVEELKQRHARLRPEAAHHDMNQVYPLHALKKIFV